MQRRSPLVRFGLWALPVSGITFVAGYFVNGGLPKPAPDAIAFNTAVAAPTFALGAFINLAGLLILPFGFIALFARLSERGAKRVLLSAMLLSLLGLEMTLVGYGVIVFDLPVVGRLFAAGEATPGISIALLTNSTVVAVLVASGLVYSIGSLLFTVVLLRDHYTPTWVPVSFGLSAFLLSFGPTLPVPAPWADVLGAVLLAGSGWHIALRPAHTTRASAPTDPNSTMAA